MFNKILIVNRGEIAVRVIRACKELGIRSAVVYSEADRFSLHVRHADESYALKGNTPKETYLNYPLILQTAKDIGADAIHPGYGFLSENEEFITSVENSGITFIGPSSASVRMMGSKTAARQLMKRNGVPIVPGTTEPIQSIVDGKKTAAEIGYPVILKASLGGGGKGMKSVFTESEFEDAFLSAQREALKAFGDDAVYIEKLIINPKHIEVQIIGDKHGNYVHLFERECSIQRRHQKIIEEAPSSFVDSAVREKLTMSAINAAKACNYYNAGTIEFLMDADKNFYFLEMNTRLQVEHPVTELITCIDLVKEQISVAAGNVLSFTQGDVKLKGHAIECRVYAEDPVNNFLPSTGTVNFHRIPSGPGIRVDEGIDTGAEISTFYDPLLTKISAISVNRKDAIMKMNHALSQYLIGGLQTNIPLLKWILEQETFLSGNYSISFIDDEFLTKEPVKLLQTRKDDFEDVAAAFSVIMKIQRKRKSTILSIASSGKNNQWKDQLYE
ncbi:MAG: acetyl-CoA carboxylase biotin carboxylase subunit [Ignavibacteriales bacterium]|nr:acetyl-CoA carboxylase biotin carboxylase subunit [Ignavibacteriales bacterium]